jgi:hypothetical protein
MFGGFIESASKDAEFAQEATGAFDSLVDALAALQEAGVVRRDEPQLQAHFIWSVVHGIAMLAINGLLAGFDPKGEALNQYALERLRDAIRAA